MDFDYSSEDEQSSVRIESKYSEHLLHHSIIDIPAEENAEGGGGASGGDDVPHLVSVGPNHYGNPKLLAMETQKTELLRRESAKWNSNTESSLTDALLELEERTRNCYSSKFNMDSEAFVKMMLTDAVFLISLFTHYDQFSKGDGELPNSVFPERLELPYICHDLLMLENQLPFFILAQVYVILSTNETQDSLKKLALQFFKQVHFGKVAVMASISRFEPKEEPKHLLALFHSSFIDDQVEKGEKKKKNKSSSSSSSPLQTGMKYLVNNASALTYSGVTFIAKSKGGRPLDIKFDHWFGELEIPTFCIDDLNMSIIGNLVGYEQRSPRNVRPYFTSLAVFFSNIAATPEDVQLLRKNGIIQHQPGNDEMVILLLRKLVNTVDSSFGDCVIKSQVHRINGYVTSRRARVIDYITRQNLVHSSIIFIIGILINW